MCLFFFCLFWLAEFVIDKRPTTTAVPTTTTTRKPTAATKKPRRKPHIIVKPPMPTRNAKRKNTPLPPTTARKMTQTPTSSTITKAKMKTTVKMATTATATTPTGRPTGVSVYRSTATDSPNSVSTIHTSMSAVRQARFLLLCSMFVLFL